MVLITLTVMLVVADLANMNDAKIWKNDLKPWQIGTHPKVLGDSYPMSTNTTGLRSFSKIFASSCFGQK